jgi:hypothetical protein
MKTQKNSSRRAYLRRRNNRWKWIVGATAATAAGVPASQGGLVTIHLVDQVIGGQSGENTLNADLTGDGHPDMTITNFTSGGALYAAISLNGIRAYCELHDSGGRSNESAYAGLGSKRAFWREYRNSSGKYISSGTGTLMGSIPVFFKDLHINGGAPTEGSLEVTVSGPGFFIQLDSLTYNSNVPPAGLTAAVPDQGSTLALLAMGAGGVIALRRRRAAQTRS